MVEEDPNASLDGAMLRRAGRTWGEGDDGGGGSCAGGAEAIAP